MQCIRQAMLTPAADACVGAISGCVEVLLMQPAVAWKNALQDGYTLSLAPRNLYRGLGVNLASISPITAVQFGVDSALATAYTKLTGIEEASPVTRIALSAAAGGASAAVSTPAELVMIQQQKAGGTMGDTARRVARSFGGHTLFKGMAPCIFRESVYTAAYLGLSPLLKEELMANSRLFQSSQQAASLVSALVSGVTASLLTQPADTIKTRMQAHLGPHEPYNTTKETAQKVWREGGLRLMYSGIVPRSLRVSVAVLCLMESKEFLTNLAVSARTA
eukprot:jgi/Chlat1/1612/Chrsp127S01872